MFFRKNCCTQLELFLQFIVYTPVVDTLRQKSSVIEAFGSDPDLTSVEFFGSVSDKVLKSKFRLRIQRLWDPCTRDGSG